MVASLSDLDALADELLVKSEETSELEDKEKPDKEDVKPEDIAEGAEESEDKPEESKEDEEPEEKEEDKEEPDEEPEEESKEDMEKSLQSDFAERSEIQQGMEASEFLTAVVDVLSKSLCDVQYEVRGGFDSQVEANSILAKSLKATLQMNSQLAEENRQLKAQMESLEKSITNGFVNIMGAIEEIGSQPASVRKSVKSVSIQDRDFVASSNGYVKPSGFESLSKSQVIGVLETEMIQGNPLVTPSDIIGYESGAPLREELKALVSSKTR